MSPSQQIYTATASSLSTGEMLDVLSADLRAIGGTGIPGADTLAHASSKAFYPEHMLHRTRWIGSFGVITAVLVIALFGVALPVHPSAASWHFVARLLLVVGALTLGVLLIVFLQAVDGARRRDLARRIEKHFSL